MSPYEIRLVQESWQHAAPMRARIGADFYRRLRQENPELRPLLNGQAADKPHELFTTFSSAVSHLDHLELIRDALRQLGQRQRRFGTVPAHYALVADSLIASLAATLDDKFDRRTKAAWQAAMAVIGDEMLAGAESPQAERVA